MATGFDIGCYIRHIGHVSVQTSSVDLILANQTLLNRFIVKLSIKVTSNLM